MRKTRYTRELLPDDDPVPFETVEAAWFWYIRCQKARDCGMRLIRGMELTARPCLPDDIYRAVKNLVARRAIGAHHVEALRLYGGLERPPDPRCEEEMSSFTLWDQALDRLATVLKAKGIVQ